MTSNNPADKKPDMDGDTPIDMKGSELHLPLKNQPGEQGDPDHATADTTPAAEIDGSLKDVVSEGKTDTAVAAALKKAIED